jgi:hypothetical protein
MPRIIRQQTVVENGPGSVESRIAAEEIMRIRQHAKTAVVFASAIGILLSLPVLATRRGSIAAQAAQESKPKPAPEMEKLNFYLGEWDYTETYGKGPNGPKNTGVYTSKLGPGGNSLINTFHSQGPVGDFEGLLVFTWEPKEKAYKLYVFGNNLPGALVETGVFEGDTLVFRSELTAQGVTVKLRNTTRVTEPGKMVSEQFMARKDAPEALLVHVEAKKR